MTKAVELPSKYKILNRNRSSRSSVIFSSVFCKIGFTEIMNVNEIINRSHRILPFLIKSIEIHLKIRTMKIISTNLAIPTKIVWKGKEQETGIYKTPTDHAIRLEVHDVKGDAVIDRRYHGGVDKACYLYSADHYPHWRKEYPDKDLLYGMFGENLTVEGLEETKLMIGATYQVGSAKVQVSEPRQPCYKLGVRFEDQGVLKKFVNSTYSGVYIRVIEPGDVKVGDEFVLLEEPKQGLTIAEVYELTYTKFAEPELMRLVMVDQYLPEYLKVKLLGKHGAQ